MLFFFFLDGDVPRSTSYGVCISQLIRYARVSSHVTDFTARNKILTGKLQHQGIGIINFENLFQNFIADTMIWFQIQGQIKISFATGPIGTGIITGGFLIQLMGTRHF